MKAGEQLEVLTEKWSPLSILICSYVGTAFTRKRTMSYFAIDS